MGSNQIVDISPLANLPSSLRWLTLDQNQIVDISPLANLPPSLEYLHLSDNEIQDLSSVLVQAGYMENLHLSLYGNPGFDQNQVDRMIENRPINRQILTLMSGVSLSRISRRSSLRRRGVKNLTDLLRGVEDFLKEK